MRVPHSHALRAPVDVVLAPLRDVRGHSLYGGSSLPLRGILPPSTQGNRPSTCTPESGKKAGQQRRLTVPTEGSRAVRPGLLELAGRLHQGLRPQVGHGLAQVPHARQLCYAPRRCALVHLPHRQPDAHGGAAELPTRDGDRPVTLRVDLVETGARRTGPPPPWCRRRRRISCTSRSQVPSTSVSTGGGSVG